MSNMITHTGRHTLKVSDKTINYVSIVGDGASGRVCDWRPIAHYSILFDNNARR